MDERFEAVNMPAEVRSLLLFSDLNGDDPENLRKRIRSGFEVDTVKQNPKRKVYRLRCPDGSLLYLKLFAGQNFLQAFFRFNARQEYLAARTLEKAGLPMIRYLAWGPRPCTGRYRWHRAASHFPACSSRYRRTGWQVSCQAPA